jgi:hypothetical protein
VYGTLAWPQQREVGLKAGGEAIVEGPVRLTGGTLTLALERSEPPWSVSGSLPARSSSASLREPRWTGDTGRGH